MIRNLKALGLALIAVTAMSVVVASAAQATTFSVGATPATITGQNIGEHILTVTKTDGQLVNAKCPAASLEGTTTEAQVSSLELTATYGPGCQLFGAAATVQMNGCKYFIHNATPTVSTTGLVDITGCTSGKKIEIKSAICTITIGEQANLSHIVVTNVTATPKDVTANATVGNIVSTQDGALCPDKDNETRANASFAGNTTLRAFVDPGTAQVTKHNHQYTEHLCGAQVDLLAS